MSRDVLADVEAHLIATLGEWAAPNGRAEVAFLGVSTIEVLRFGPDAEGLWRYATLGMSAAPMADPAAAVADPVAGPRAELVLSMRGGPDSVARRLAVLAAAPAVEGIVVAPGVSLDLGQPLWEGAPFTAVLVGEPNGLVADLPLPAPMEPVRFLPVLPMTANEQAYKRVHGAAELTQRWLSAGIDLRDPSRLSVNLA